MVRFLRPATVIEVGAGNSTWFARDALRLNGGGQLVAIDPDPRLAPPRECILIQDLIQNVDIQMFRNLHANDVLFIDSSHSLEEATYTTESIFPSLQKDVFVHIHDVVFPYRGYSSFVPPAADIQEQEVILEFLRNHRESFEVFTSSAFARYENPHRVSQLIPSKKHRPKIAGGSLWIRKRI